MYKTCAARAGAAEDACNGLVGMSIQKAADCGGIRGGEATA